MEPETYLEAVLKRPLMTHNGHLCDLPVVTTAITHPHKWSSKQGALDKDEEV